MVIKIGVFDSGIGGLSVVRELKRIMPHQPVIYFGDTARTPYGPKSRETLVRYTEENIKFLRKNGADIVVIACHSAASATIDILANRFHMPVFEVISPSVREAVSITRYGRIGIIGTRATVLSGIYEMKIPEIRPDSKVFSQACPLLVPLVEEGWFKARETRMIVKKYLRPLKNRQIDTLVLGCTHYPLLKSLIKEKAGKNIKVVDPSAQVAQDVSDWVRREQGFVAESMVEPDRYFISDLAPATKKVVRYFMGSGVVLEKSDSI